MKKRKIKPIGTIAQERKACIAAFRAHPKATWCWCCHHQCLVEPLTDHYMVRIRFISKYKETWEKAVRFRNLRPVKSRDGTCYSVVLLNKEWPHNTWEGFGSRSDFGTIFSQLD